jgi:hypothetical protein
MYYQIRTLYDEYLLVRLPEIVSPALKKNLNRVELHGSDCSIRMAWPGIWIPLRVHHNVSPASAKEMPHVMQTPLHAKHEDFGLMLKLVYSFFIFRLIMAKYQQ